MSVTGMSEIISDLNRLITATRQIGIAANTVHAEMANRIFVEGKDINGNLIGDGDYSPAYAAKRNIEGRQTAKIDLRFTGAMERSFVCQVANDGIWESGFMQDFEAQKMTWNEERYQQEIAILSDTEEKHFAEYIEDLAKEILV